MHVIAIIIEELVFMKNYEIKTHALTTQTLQ